MKESREEMNRAILTKNVGQISGEIHDEISEGIHKEICGVIPA